MHNAYLIKNLICVLAACITHLACISANAFAQNAPITSSGLNTQVSGPISVGEHVQYDITGGTRPNGGPNLFHSFGEFGVPNNTIANFLNTPRVETTNILGRVTGGHISNIFGAIQTDGFEGANLFLMNPAGFLFGPNAAIHVGGMVSFTSADYLKFEDGKRFNAIPSTTDALLSASPVAAFGFLGSNPEAITVQGSHLAVTDGTGISLVGGNITIESGANLSAPNGKIQLASTASPGAFDALTLQANPNVNGASFTSSSSVSLAPGSTVNLSGKDTVSIRGGQFVLSVNDAALNTAGSAGAPNSISLSPGSAIISSNASTGPGPEIQISTATVQVNGGTLSTETHGSGTGGTITVDGARTINIAEGSTLSTLSDGKEQAGNIVLYATDSIILSNSFINSDAASFSSEFAGNGGLIHLNAPKIDVHNSLLSTSTLGAGDAGTILLEARRLNIGFDTKITAFTQGPGKGGKITVQGLGGEGKSAEDVEISGGSLLLSRTSKAGPAGEIRITTDQLTISGNSQVNANSETGSGAAGNISIEANSFTLRNGSTVSTTTSGSKTATGGTITVTANQVQLDSGASITAKSTGLADAGNIDVTATNGLTMQNGSSITTRVVSNVPDSTARGGDITVTTSPTATVNIQDSTINASVPGKGDGGNVTIDPYFVILQNGRILSQTDQGTGGNINITARVFLHDAGTVISADATRGVNGTVTIQSPYAPASGQIQPMVNRPLQATSLLNQSCAAMAGGQFSSFTVAGNRLPIEPGGWLSSPLALAVSESHDDTRNNKHLQTSLGETRGKLPRLSLRQIVPPGFLTQAYAVESATGCRS